MTQQEARKDRSANKSWQRRLWIFGAPLAVVGVCALLKSMTPNVGVNAANPGAPQTQQAPGALPAGPDARQITPSKTISANPNATIVANINGEEINRTKLAAMCMERFGKPVIEAMINKQLIQQYCTQANIQVTNQDVAAEIARLAQKFGMTSDDYLKMLKQERGIQPQQYGSEIIWPTLALRRLAAQNIQPTQQELDQAFESQYGEAVKARIIVFDNMQKAQQVLAEAAKKPDEFAALARKHSCDPSASVNGMIQPIRHHVGDKGIEAAAFQLQDGQISQIIPITMPGAKAGEPGTQQFVILRCEGRVAAVNVDRKTVELRLRDSIMDRKLRDEAAKIYQQLSKSADLKNVYNNPELRQQHPGMVALVNGVGISEAQLLEECVLRNGTDVLESVINRQLLEQTLKARNIQVTKDDIDGEIARAALTMGKRNANGGPDVEAWVKAITEENGCSAKVYIEDAVWPSVALKKLAGAVQVTDEDLQKGYQANYGSKVRCRAILQDNMRKAQDIWNMARENPTAEAFGKLAEQYSTDPSSKALQGKIPAIQRFGGQPKIEEVAFSLKPGELSGIITLGNNHVILFCESYTEPSTTKFEEVKDFIKDDLIEKKQRIAMSDTYRKIKEGARIDNYLAGTTHSPVKQAAANQEPEKAYQGALPTNPVR